MIPQHNYDIHIFILHEKCYFMKRFSERKEAKILIIYWILWATKMFFMFFPCSLFVNSRYYFSFLEEAFLNGKNIRYKSLMSTEKALGKMTTKNNSSFILTFELCLWYKIVSFSCYQNRCFLLENLSFFSLKVQVATIEY